MALPLREQKYLTQRRRGSSGIWRGGDEEGDRVFDAGVKGCQLQAVGGGELAEVGVGGSGRCRGPEGEGRGGAVGDVAASFFAYLSEGSLCVGKRETESLHGNTHESEFNKGCSHHVFVAGSQCPPVKGCVMRRAGMPPRDERVYVEEVFHGKSASAALICSSVTIGPGVAS